MKIDRHLKSGLPNIVFDSSDISDLVRIIEMFNGHFLCRKCGTNYENKAWDTLKKYWESERIKLIFQMKMAVSLNRVGESDTKVEVAKLAGFDHFLEIEDKIKFKLEKLQEKIEQEADHGTDDES